MHIKDEIATVVLSEEAVVVYKEGEHGYVSFAAVTRNRSSRLHNPGAVFGYTIDTQASKMWLDGEYEEWGQYMMSKLPSGTTAHELRSVVNILTNATGPSDSMRFETRAGRVFQVDDTGDATPYTVWSFSLDPSDPETEQTPIRIGLGKQNSIGGVGYLVGCKPNIYARDDEMWYSSPDRTYPHTAMIVKLIQRYGNDVGRVGEEYTEFLRDLRNPESINRVKSNLGLPT